MSAPAFCLYKDWKKQNVHAVARYRRIMHTFPSYLTGFVSYPDVKHFCTFVTNQLESATSLERFELYEKFADFETYQPFSNYMRMGLYHTMQPSLGLNWYAKACYLYERKHFYVYN